MGVSLLLMTGVAQAQQTPVGAPSIAQLEQARVTLIEQLNQINSLLIDRMRSEERAVAAWWAAYVSGENANKTP